jgi:toxin ParE1/3/4
MLLSRQARADLEDIRRYPVKTGGRPQWLAYYRQIVEAFGRIVEGSERGRDRSLFIEGMRSINCQKHVIFYKRIKAADDAVVVLRIVHQQRNLPALVYYDDLDAPT